MGEAYLSTKHLAVGYRNIPLIREIALSIKKGEIVTLIGPNGAGKSTILKSLIRQIPIVSGEVTLEERNLEAFSGRELASRVSILMTEPVGAELMSGREVAAAGRYPYTGKLGILGTDDWEKVDRALRLVCASEFADRDFRKLSDGQRQRILLARAICQEPRLLVMDEPTSYLDIRHKLEFLSLLRGLVREEKIAALLSLHELELAQKVSDRVVCVKGETIFAVGTPEEIFRESVMGPLFDLRENCYIESSGTVEFADAKEQVKAPEYFVICGAGSGIPVFRRLQRENVPFAAGILPENDMDYPVARALAAEVVSSPAYEPIPHEVFERAVRVMGTCRRVICARGEFGSLLEVNNRLLELAHTEKLL